MGCTHVNSSDCTPRSGAGPTPLETPNHAAGCRETMYTQLGIWRAQRLIEIVCPHFRLMTKGQRETNHISIHGGGENNHAWHCAC
eukprot:1144846-Pelagomonas_calceolata.AAC.2